MNRAQLILERLELFGVRLGLDTTRPLLAALGNPQKRVATVLVAGTNGKGSTATLLAAMACAAGYRVGLYTSPHLEAVEERLRIDGRAVGEEKLGELLATVVNAGEEALADAPTYFEALTAAAWLWFAESGVDLAVMEVGMGGRLDATNAGDPILSVVTPIGLDHTRHLGESLPAIAREKAGIFRPGVAAMSWPGSDPAEAALVDAATQTGTPLLLAPKAVRDLVSQPREMVGQRVELRTPKGRHQIDLPLAGHHQAENLALAVLAAEALAAQGYDRLDHAAIRAGAEGCRWPGRLEQVICPPPHQGRELLLDAAHNPLGVETLARFLARWSRSKSQGFDLLFGAFANKNAEEMLSVLSGQARRVILTAPQGRRAFAPRELAQWVADREPILEAQPARALRCGLAGEGLLVVTGSLYLVGEVRGLVRQQLGVPPSPVTSIFSPRLAVAPTGP